MSAVALTSMVGSDQGSGHRIPSPQGDQEWGGVDPEGRGLGSSVIGFPPSLPGHMAGYGYPPAVPVSDNENQDNNCELQDNGASQIISGVFHLAIHREVTDHEIYFSGK